MKHCNGCDTDKPVDQFSIKSRSTGLRQSKCKTCMNEIAHQHYLNNKAMYKEKASKSNSIARKRNNLYIFDYLSTHPCVDCGHQDIRVLEFDHVRGKNANIGNLTSGSLKRLKEEIALCEVRCANCHTIRTGTMYGWRVDRREQVV